MVYDPELSRDLPLAVAGPSAMNALAHCVDALWSPGATPVTTLLAERGGAGAARRACEAMDGRGRLLYGAALAGWALGVAGTALHHRICHMLGGTFDLPHAETHSAVLPQVTALNAPAVPEAARLGSAQPRRGVFDLAERAGSPTSPARARTARGGSRRRRALGRRGGDRQPRAGRRERLALSCSEPGRALDRMASRERARFGPAGGGSARRRLTGCRQRVGRRRAIASLLLRTCVVTRSRI